MRFCKKCVMPDTRPDLYFDEQGICDACYSYEKKIAGESAINWKSRESEFESLIGKYCNNSSQQYDCVIPVSGGKDSHYTLYIAKKRYGLNPLCVYFEPTILTDIGKKNLENISKLGVDILCFKKNPIVYDKLILEGLRRVGDNEWINHQGIWSYPVRVAINYNIPLILWGESPQMEYGGAETVADINKKIFNEDWLNDYGCLNGLRPQDLVSENLGIKFSDMIPYIYPTKEEVANWGGLGIFLGYYFKWNDTNQLDAVESIGFERCTGRIEISYTNYEKLDCLSMNIHDYLKYLKYGYGRATDSACRDVRNSIITREEAVRLAERYDGTYPRGIIDVFCKRFNLSIEEFDTICDSYTNKTIFETDSTGKLVRDIDRSLVMRKDWLQARKNPGAQESNNSEEIASDLLEELSL